MGQNFVGQDVTGAISLGQNVVGQEDSGAGRRGAELRGAGPVLDRERFSDRDREREREWQKVPGTGINRERE